MPEVPAPEAFADYDEDEIDKSVERPNPAPPPSGRLIVKRNGHSITRKVPKPVILIDTRERTPFDFKRFPNWIAAEKRQKLDAGDYSIQGMEDVLAVERKTLSDLITTTMQQRQRFFKMCEKLTQYRWRALIIEASYEDIKSPYSEEYNTLAHPKRRFGDYRCIGSSLRYTDDLCLLLPTIG